MKFNDIIKKYGNDEKIPHPNIFLINDEISNEEIKFWEILLRRLKIKNIIKRMRSN